MKKCKIRWVQSGIALCCSLAIVLSVFPSSADSNIDALEGQTSDLQSQLAGINEEILSLSQEISTTEMQVEIINGEIARTTDALAQAEDDEAKQYEDMKTRIKYMYEHGDATLLEMLFSAEDMADFLNKADFIEHLSQYDRNALEDLKTVHQQIQEEKDILETQQDSLKELQAELNTQQQQLQAKAVETSTNLADVQAKLEKAKADEAARIAAEKAAQEAAAAAAANNSSNNSGSSAGSTVEGGYDSSIVNGGGYDASTDDVTLLASIIQCEAYQSYDCLLAVATVIMNRVESPRFPNSISGVVYAGGQFEPVWTGRLDAVLSSGPSDLSYQVAQDAINGARLAAVSDCYYFLYAGATDRDGVNIGNNLFFQSW